jgi:AcrR family transcriptional regulator
MNTESPLRPSARQELAAATRERAMNALAAVLRAGGEVTFEAIAQEAAVPIRTLYRHFPSKDDLFGAFWPWMNERIEMPSRPTTPEEVIGHIPELYAAFDRDDPLVRAMLHNPHGRAIRNATAAARREKFASALQEVTASLNAYETLKLLAGITTVCSAAGWESMKDNWGLSGPAAAEAAQWAVTALINEARGRKR